MSKIAANTPVWAISVSGWLHRNERSQAWLAEKANVSRSHLSKCMSGQLQPSSDLLGRLEAVMREYGLPEAITLTKEDDE